MLTNAIEIRVQFGLNLRFDAPPGLRLDRVCRSDLGVALDLTIDSIKLTECLCAVDRALITD